MKANNKKQTTPEDRLLKAIFKDGARSNAGTVDDEYDENYPDTNADKIGYAVYAITKSLERISPALVRLRRLDSLYTVMRGAPKDLPDIIAHNEARMALQHLVRVKGDIDDAYKEVMTVLGRTAEKAKEEGKE